MACTRGCTGTPICNALGLCCLQIQHDCGKDCGDIPVGYSVLRVNAAGALEVCSNVGGVCECVEVGADSPASVVTDNADGTWDHDDGDGTIVTLDVCQLIQDGGCVDTLVNNADGTFTHTSVDGTPVVLDICQMIIDGACSDTLVDIGNGSFTHTAVDGTIVTLNVCDLLTADNCIFNAQAFGGLATIAPAVPPPVPTLLEPASTVTITNTSDTPANCQVVITNQQINAANTNVVPTSVIVNTEFTLDGGGTWIPSPTMDTTLQLDAAGTPGAFLEVASGGFVLDAPIAAGASRTVGIRRFYSSPDGFTGPLIVDGVTYSMVCTALP